jgi:hypothetical protein
MELAFPAQVTNLNLTYIYTLIPTMAVFVPVLFCFVVTCKIMMNNIKSKRVKESEKKLRHKFTWFRNVPISIGAQLFQ